MPPSAIKETHLQFLTMHVVLPPYLPIPFHPFPTHPPICDLQVQSECNLSVVQVHLPLLFFFCFFLTDWSVCCRFIASLKLFSLLLLVPSFPAHYYRFSNKIFSVCLFTVGISIRSGTEDESFTKVETATTTEVTEIQKVA